jgi:phospholipid/cholesterol/gamma-HCH transport system ATP-binding protein
MPAEPIIRVEHFTAGYDGNILMRDINFTVNRGEVFVILGGSGCGKSTLMKHMIGLYEPIAGAVYIDGDDIVTAEGDARRATLKKIGVMYQSGALFGSMTLLENIRLPLEEYTSLDDDAIDLVAQMKLKLVGLDAFSGHMPSEISGGMQKRARSRARWPSIRRSCFSTSRRPDSIPLPRPSSICSSCASQRACTLRLSS